MKKNETVFVFLNISHLTGDSTAQQIREKLLRVLLYFASAIGGLIYIFALFPVVQEKLFGAVLLYSLFYFTLVGIAFIPGVSYRFRAYSWIFILYFLAINNLIYSGLNVDAGLFFITHVIMTALLLDLRRAIISLFLNLFSISFAGFLIVAGDVNFVLGLPQTDPVLWLVGGTIFLLMGLVSTISVGTLINGLVDNLRRLEETSSTLTLRNKEIQESESNYRVLFDTSPDVIVRFDLNGIIKAVNYAGEKILGLPRNRILEMNIDEFIQSDERSLANQMFEEALREGMVRDAELRIRSFSGVAVFVEFSIAQILDANNNIVGLIAVGKDVSEKKRISKITQAQREELIKNQNQLRDLARR